MNKSPAAFVGAIASDSPLMWIFPDGRAPLRGPNTQSATLGNSKVPEDVYMLSLSECTDEELRRIVDLVQEIHGGLRVEVERFVLVSNALPIRARNITGVSFSLRYVL